MRTFGSALHRAAAREPRLWSAMHHRRRQPPRGRAPDEGQRQKVTQRAILQPGVQPGVPEEDKEGIAGDYSKNIKSESECGWLTAWRAIDGLALAQQIEVRRCRTSNSICGNANGHVCVGGYLSAKPSSAVASQRPPRAAPKWGAGGGLDPPARVLDTTHTAKNRSLSEVRP